MDGIDRLDCTVVPDPADRDDIIIRDLDDTVSLMIIIIVRTMQGNVSVHALIQRIVLDRFQYITQSLYVIAFKNIFFKSGQNIISPLNPLRRKAMQAFIPLEYAPG